MTAGSETGAHVVITLHQTLTPRHLAVIGNTGPSSDPQTPRGEVDAAHLGLDLTG